MTALQIALLIGLMLVVPGVVLTRDPRSQAVAIGFYGLLLALVFTVFEAPDVALAQLAVGAVALPLMVLLALARVRRQAEIRAAKEQQEDGGE